MAELSVMDRINMILSDPEKATMTLAQIVSRERGLVTAQLASVPPEHD